MRTRLAAALLGFSLLLAACVDGSPSSSDGAGADAEPAPTTVTSGGESDGAVLLDTTTSDATRVASSTYVAALNYPERRVADTTTIDDGPALGEDAGPQNLAAGVVPAPNQFWTSLIAPDGPRRLWLTPLAVDLDSRGLSVARPRPAAGDDEIVTAWSPQLRVEGDFSNYEVTGYGDFSVSVTLGAGGAEPTLSTTFAQGHPAVSLTTSGGRFAIAVLGDASVEAADGMLVAQGDTVTGTLIVRGAAQTWTIASSNILTWQWDGSLLFTGAPADTTVTLAADPDDATDLWLGSVEDLAQSPVSTTVVTAVIAAGAVEQTLIWDGSQDVARPVVLLPHQSSASSEELQSLGYYDSIYGRLEVAAARSVVWTAPLPGLLQYWPTVAVEPSLIAAAVAADAERKPVRSGSYFGATDLHAVTSSIDALAATDMPFNLQAADAASELIDRLTWSGAGDDRWLYYEPTWQTHLTAAPEFGSERFNDRHFHHGYLLHAAATLETRNPGSLISVQERLDVLAAGLLGSGSPSISTWAQSGSPTVGGGSFSPYLGHSFADGLALSNRGNNQESSSEAVNAWSGLARWGAATGRDGLRDAGLIRYAIEAATARAYWLGDEAALDPLRRSPVGIIWGDRIERRTFFSARPEAVVGIQLLPFTPGSLYREEPRDTPAIWLDATQESSMWADLFLMDRALREPDEALALLSRALRVSADEGLHHGHTWMSRLVWTAMLVEFGQPTRDVYSWPPYGRGFLDGELLTLVATNPTSAQLTVLFWRAGEQIGSVLVQPGSTATSVTDPRG